MIKPSEDSINIAFATSNGNELNEHFGSCMQLCIYNLTPTSNEHLTTVFFTPSDEGHNSQKIAERLATLTGCFAVYCLACGNPVRKQLLTQGTRVIIHPAELIHHLLTQIQSNWPGKIAQRQTRQRNRKQHHDYFTDLSDSEWE